MSDASYHIYDEDVERYIERQIVVTLRTLFTLDERYQYSINDKDSEFSITGDFPVRETPDKKTSIVVTGISYSFNLQQTLNQNISEDIYVKNTKGYDVLVGSKFRCRVPFQCTIMCEGEASRVKDLANKVTNILAFTGKKVIDNLGLIIYNISKGSCQPKLQHPSKIFQVPVSVSGDVSWCGTYRASNPDEVATLKKVEINLELETQEILQNSNAPGVYITNK